MNATVYTVETNGIKCSFTDRDSAEAFAENNGAVVKVEGDPLHLSNWTFDPSAKASS